MTHDPERGCGIIALGLALSVLAIVLVVVGWWAGR